jgi:hypothetical protein
MDVLAWIDGPIPSARALPAWASSVEAVCQTAAIWTPRIGALHLCRWDEGRLVDALRLLQSRGLSTRLTVWATSTPHEWAAQAAWLERVLEMCAVGGVDRPGLDLDAEEAWRGTQTLAQIGEWAARWRVDVSVSYVPSMRLPSHIEALICAPWVGEVIPQAYSQYNPSKPWTHAPLIRPRVFQRHALDQLEVVQARRAQDASVRVGLMAALQSHPAPHPQGLAALDAAIETVRARGVDRLALWSYKHLTATARVNAWAVDLVRGGVS